MPDYDFFPLKVPEAAEYELVYDLDLKTLGPDIRYTVDRSAEIAGGFDGSGISWTAALRRRTPVGLDLDGRLHRRGEEARSADPEVGHRPPDRGEEPEGARERRGADQRRGPRGSIGVLADTTTGR